MTGSWPDVKICGVCRPEDAVLAVESGASHVGVIRVPDSRRTQSLEVARAIADAARSASGPAGVRVVGVFVDAPRATIVEEAGAIGLDAVQLHGTEAPDGIAELRAAGLEVWKVLKPADAAGLRTAARRYADADLLLVEGRSDRGHGGVGARFPWAELQPVLTGLEGPRIGVGGGLTPDTVAEAVRRFRPSLVDVSSGVEAALCRKSPDRVRAFVANARRAGTSVRDADMQ